MNIGISFWSYFIPLILGIIGLFIFEVNIISLAIAGSNLMFTILTGAQLFKMDEE